MYPLHALPRRVYFFTCFPQPLFFYTLISDAASQRVSPWDHYWERCVGSGRAYLAMREDWRRDLRQVHGDLGTLARCIIQLLLSLLS